MMKTFLLFTVLLISLLETPSLGQPICQGSTTPFYTDSQLSSLINCQQINGSLILGDQDCANTCTITGFSSLINLQSITGSLVIQCCNSLTSIPAIPRLTSIQGTLRIYYNAGIQSIASIVLATVGNLEISQNPLLRTIDSLQVSQVKGHLSVSYNPSLTSITGLTSLVTIQGNELVNGHALILLYNTVLTDISGLVALDAIEHGTVHIEGNTQLCYSGYPRWTYDVYAQRYSTGDRGIDWRTKLAVANSWQFTWGGNGVPTLNIQDNGNHSTCVSATCHTSCANGVGCLGPNSPDLCGTCYQTSEINSCNQVNAPETITETCVTLWPPTELPFSAIFGLLVAFGGTLLIIILIGVLVIVYKIRKRYTNENEGSYSVQTTVESGSPQRTRERNKHLVEIEACQQSPGYQPVGSTFATKETSLQRRYSSEEEDEEEEEEEEETEREYNEQREYSDEEDTAGNELMEEFEFPSRKVHVMKEIGDGAFGKVYEGIASDIIPGERQTQVVVKECYSEASEEDMDCFLQPAEEMRHHKHENVIHLLGVCVDGPNMLLVLEHCSNGNLKTYLQKNRSRKGVMKKDGTLLKMMIDMAKGLRYLHELSIAHNDFAARNCLVCADNSIKVGDYGTSRQHFKADYYTRTPGQITWPVRWMAPEIIIDGRDGLLDSEQETDKSNSWSFGISMWEVCTCAEQPYNEMTDEEVITQLVNRRYCSLPNPVPGNDPLNSLFIIMKKCWKESVIRPSMDDMVYLLQNVTINTAGEDAEERKMKYRHSADLNVSTSKKKTRRESQEPLLSRQSYQEDRTRREDKVTPPLPLATIKEKKKDVKKETMKKKPAAETRTKMEPKHDTSAKSKKQPTPAKRYTEDSDDSFISNNEMFNITPVHPPITTRDSKSSNESVPLPSSSKLSSQPPPKSSQRYSKESWDSFDDTDEEEQVEYPPPPPTEFSQEEEDFNEHEIPIEIPIEIHPLPPQDTANDWEESEPVVSPVKFDKNDKKNEKKDKTPEIYRQRWSTTSQTTEGPLQEDDISTDDERTEPVLPVKLDNLDDYDQESPQEDQDDDSFTNVRKSRAEEDSDEINVPMQRDKEIVDKSQSTASSRSSKKEDKAKQKAKKKEAKEQKKKDKKKWSKTWSPQQAGESNEHALVW